MSDSSGSDQSGSMESSTDGTGDAADGEPTAAGTEPGFGDVAGSEALPDMTDTLPTLSDSYGDSTESSGPQGQPDGTADGGVPGAEGSPSGQPPGSSATGDVASAGRNGDSAAPGTRASGGLEPMAGADGTLTAAEQVAILDRQLEQSTSDFDTMILEEQARQRELERERAARTAQREQAEPAGPGTAGRNPYESDVAMGGGGQSTGGGMGGASAGGGAPDNPAIYKPPADIPQGNDDDVVARQLREAAMREPDPEVRERLWNEYRKYKGLEIPEE